MSAAPTAGTDRPGMDRLELELRLLPGVAMVGIEDAVDPVSVELVVVGPEAVDRVRSEATRLIDAVLDRPAVLEVVTDGMPAADAGGSRVRLFATRAGDLVDLHLSHRDRRAAVSAAAGDGMGVAAAVLEGLSRLGLGVPYRAAAVGALPETLGAGMVVVLADRAGRSCRRGIAMGSSPEEAAARAVLNALNRYLQDPEDEEQGDS